jgi:hypothetical protein
MAEINPAEVSSILREQLAGVKSAAELEEVGTVLQVGDGIARIYGLTNVESGELIEFENGVRGIALNLEEDNVGAVLLEPSGDLKEGASVRRSGRIASVRVGEGMLGRVVNTLGEPIDVNREAAGVIAALFQAWEQFEEGTWSRSFRKLWASHDVLAGKSVRVGLRGDPVAGIVDGIDDEGSLILRTGGGRKTIVSSGEVTLRKP